MVAWRSFDNHRAGIPDVLPFTNSDLGEYVIAIASGAQFSTIDEAYMAVEMPGNEQFGVVTGGMKLIYHRGFGRVELFDLNSDPFERDNLAEVRADDVRRLTSLLWSNERSRWLARPVLGSDR